jgi:predicted Ser/Thr protein kinase
MSLHLDKFFQLYYPRILLATFMLFPEYLHFMNCARAQQNVNIIQATATLSEGRYNLAATSSGELVFFGGGHNATIGPSDRVDIYNVTNGTWTTATLSIPRSELAATSSGNLVFFGGGWNLSVAYDRVDIYNISDGSWNIANLSSARVALAATSVGNLVLFSGGYSPLNSSFLNYYKTVDIYNVTGNVWSSALLSAYRSNLAATSVANRYALFGGGNFGMNPSNVVDIYDSLCGMWSSATLSLARTALTATSLGNLAFFAGGNSDNPNQTFNVVDIFNSTSQTWNIATLSQNRSWLASASIGEIVAFGGGELNLSSLLSVVVDMCNVTSNVWFTANLSQARIFLAATSSINKILFGGGLALQEDSNVVDIFEIPISLQPPSSPLQSPSPLSSCTNSSSTSTSSVSPLPFQSSSVTMNSTSSMSLTLSSMNLIPSNSEQQMTSMVVVGIVVGIGIFLIGIGIILFLVLFIKKRRKRREKQMTETKNAAVAFNEISLKQSNETKSTNQTSTMSICEISTSLSGVIRFNDIFVEKEVGEGSYGKVYVGKWNGAHVALKFCKNKGQIEEFTNEMKLMIELPPHPNVIQVFGISLDGPQPVIVMEYCAGGSLDKLLFDSNVKLSDEDKIRLVRGIALGMFHLHKHNIVHRDLAARNILLTASGDPKISDFGMSRIVEREEGKTKHDMGPIRWMAPESLANRTYSKKSDVWSFGIVVYEIVARCEPHKGENIFRVVVQIMYFC